MNSPLTGRLILIAEDEPLIALARIMHHAAQFRTPDGGRASPSLFQGGVSQLAVQRA